MTKEELIKQLQKDVDYALVIYKGFDTSKGGPQPEDFYYWLGRLTSYETALRYAKELSNV